MLDKNYNKFLIKHINSVKNQDDYNNQIFINEPNVYYRMIYILKNIDINNNNICIISDEYLLDIIAFLKFLNKKYIIVSNIKNIVEISNYKKRDLLKIDFFIIRNKKIQFNDVNNITLFLNFSNLKMNKNNYYDLFYVFLFYLNKKIKKYNNILFFNINSIKINTKIINLITCLNDICEDFTYNQINNNIYNNIENQLIDSCINNDIFYDFNIKKNNIKDQLNYIENIENTENIKDIENNNENSEYNNKNDIKFYNFYNEYNNIYNDDNVNDIIIINNFYNNNNNSIKIIKTSLLEINLKIKYKNLYFFNDLKNLSNISNISDLRHLNLIKNNLYDLLKFKINKNLFINEYLFIDILKIKKDDIIFNMKIELINELIEDEISYNIKLNDYLDISKYNTFNFIFNKIIPYYYYHDIENIEKMIYLLNYELNDEFNQLFFNVFNIENIVYFIYKKSNNKNLINILKKYLKSELYYINNIIERFIENVNLKTCAICYEMLNKSLVILSCCQYIMCEICAIKATYKKKLQLYHVILGICPFCNTVLELENDLILTTFDILKNIKTNKIIHTNKKSFINIIKIICNNKTAKYLKMIKINDINKNTNTYIFNKFSKKMTKSFIITLNDNKEFNDIINKFNIYNIKFIIMNDNITLINIFELYNSNKIFLFNIKNNTYQNFIKNIINKYNKYNISNILIINPKKKFNNLLYNIIFSLKSFVNIHILNNI